MRNVGKKSFIIIVVFLAFLSVLLLSGVTIPLDSLDNRLESLLSRVLDRKVTIHGPVQVKLSLQPILELGGLTIANPEDWPGENNFLTVRKGQVQIDLLPLVKGDFHINDLEFEDVDLRLVTRPDNTNNYSFSTSSDEPDKEETDHELTGLDKVSLRNIRLHYRDELSGKEYLLAIDEAHGQGMPNSSLRFSLQGTLSGLECAFDITGGSLHDLLYAKQPWPLSQGKLKVADTILDISGSLVRSKGEMAEYLELSLQGPNLDGIGSLFDISLPQTGEFSIAGQVSLLPGVFHFLNLQLDVLNSSLQGNLVLALHGKRPTLTGTLVSPHIDPAVFAAFKGERPENSTDEPRAENKDSLLPWRTLQLLDTDLHLHVDEMSLDRFKTRDIKAVVSLVNGDLVVPFSFVAMNVPVNGRADIMSSEGAPVIEFTANTGSAKLGPLLETFSGHKQFSGKLGSLALIASTHGDSLEKLKREFDMDLQIGATTFLADPWISVLSKDLSLQRRPGKSFALSGKGDFLGSPFTLQAQAGRKDGDWENAPVPINVKLQACDTELFFDAVLQGDSLGDFQFSAQGEKLCGFLDPLSDFMGRETDFSVKGDGKLYQGGWSLDLETVRLGTVKLDGRLERKVNRSGKPLIAAFLHSSEIDLSSYLQKTERSDQDSEKSSESSGKKEKEDSKELTPEQQMARTDELLANKIFPKKRLLSMDVKLDLHVEKLNIGQGSVSDIKLSATIEDGKLSDAPFQAIIAGESFLGNAKIDLTGDEPLTHFELTSDGLNLPDLYEEFGLGNAPDIKAEHLTIKVSLKGRTLLDLEKKSTQEIIIRNGTWVLAREPDEPLNITVEKARAFNTPGFPTTLTMSGDIDSEPFNIEIKGNGLFGGDTLQPVTLTVEVGLADARLHVDGKIIRKKNNKNLLNLNTSLSGEKLDRMNELLGVNLPPFGPYYVDAYLHVKKGVFTFHDLVMKVGDSTLKGGMVLSGTTNEKKGNIFPINFKTNLKAESVQLNDFQFGDWSPVAEEKKADIDKGRQEDSKQSKGTLHDLFSPELAAKFMGTLYIQVDEVLSGDDKLGSGLLNAKLKDGRYSLDNLRLDIPGGAVFIQGSLKQEVGKIAADLAMQVENLDYGVLVRRTKPDSDLKGKINLNFDIYSEAATPFQLKEHVGGKLRFGVIPEDYKAGTIDLWAVNIVTAALPALLKGSPSEVNCLAGDFILEDGIMHPEVFLLDTSKMRVKGRGEVNFKTNAIDFHLHPTPKKAHFFSLATPITVSGTITDYHIGVTAGAVLGTIFQLTTSVVTVPYHWLFTDNLETDGSKACSEAMAWAQEN